MLGAGHVGVHNGLNLAAFPQFVLAQIDLPGAVTQVGPRMAGLIPVVEFAF